jgi:eukaryotic-like serine/threonine-protein kinase
MNSVGPSQYDELVELLERAHAELLNSPAVPLKKIGQYELIERLAHGATSVVYRARDLRTGEPLVLRKLKEDDPPQEEIRRFRKAISIVERLNHPNILRLTAKGEHEGKPFAVMPLLDTLERPLAFEEWPPLRAARVLRALAEGIDHAHRNGVIHRDLKPSNILWRDGQGDEDGTPLISDFGSAQQSDPELHLSSVPRAGGFTLPYMAPEQLGREPETTAVDIYSLGVIFYEMLCGHLPHGHTLADVVAGLTSASPVVFPRESERTIPAHFRAVCLACLEKKPADRYRNAAELADDLRRLVEGHRPLRYKGRFHGAQRWLQRRPWFNVVAWGALSLVIAGAGPLWESSSAADEQNASTARELASDLLSSFDQLARAATEAASDPAVQALLEAPQVRNPAQELAVYAKGSRAGHDDQFQGMFVMRADGTMRAHYPGVTEPTQRIFNEKSFWWRDYLRGGLEGAARSDLDTERRAYVARVFLSETTGQLEFGFSAPLPPRHGTLDTDAKGILLARISVHLAMSLARLHDGKLGQMSVLLGPMDCSRPEAEHKEQAPAGFVYLAHEAMDIQVADPRDPKKSRTFLEERYERQLRHGFGLTASPKALLEWKETTPSQCPWQVGAEPMGEQFEAWPGQTAVLSGYEDPFAPTYTGKWSAAAFPIGRTGYVVLVQSKIEGTHFLQRLGVALACLAPLAAGLLIATRRSS